MKITIPKNELIWRVPEEMDLEIVVPKNSEVLILEGNKNNGDYKRVVKVEKNARVKYLDLQVGEGTTTKNVETVIELIGEGAQVDLLGLFAGQGDDNLKISHKVIHAAPRTTSRLVSKGILTGSSFAHQISRIEILPNQNGCSGDERSDTILLSDHARVIAVPELEIGNNDVQCKHAVTTTRLNKEKLFYLTSRGLDEKTSRQLLIEAHLNSILEQIPEEVRDELGLSLKLFVKGSEFACS